MLEKRVVVYLDTGVTRDHILVARDDNDYVEKINEFVAALTGSSRGILGFTTPLCIYKVQNIVAIECSDPPTENTQRDKLPIGFIRPTQS